jgi:hypothetical protein
MQMEHMWVVQVHHNRHLSQEVSQLCAHWASRTHPEGLDSHWDLEMEGSTIRHHGDSQAKAKQRRHEDCKRHLAQVS